MFNERLNNLRYFFHGRYNIYDTHRIATIGEINSRVNRIRISLNLPEADRLIKADRFVPEEDEFNTEELRANLSLEIGAHQKRIDKFIQIVPPDTAIESINSQYISATGLDNEDLEILWSKVALTPNEFYLIEALKIVNQEISDLNFVRKNDLDGARIPYVLVRKDRPIPLESLGDGLTRLFGMSLALVNAKNGFLVIDEIGSGLHFSVQLGMWRMIFQIASTLNVQVFATTHSNDCIQAFHIAANESPDEGVLIRLEKRGDLIVPVIFDEKRLSIATKEEIEVR